MADQPDVNVLLGTTIKLFNRELALVYEKNGDYHSFILIPTKMDTDTEGITLAAMEEEIGKVFGKKTDEVNMTQLTNTIPTELQQDARFTLTMAYLYFKFSKDMKERKKVEFAFQVKATGLNTLIPSLNNNNLFNIKDVQLAIWSTDNPKVIDAMHLIKPSDYIPNQE